MNALLDPVNRARGSIKWGLVAHTAATFTFVTIYIALNLNIQSLAFIDNREFPGTEAIPPGPAGYQWSILSKPVGIAPTPMLVLNNWLIDGLLASVSRLTLRVSSVDHFSSSTVVTLFTPWTTGSSPFRV